MAMSHRGDSPEIIKMCLSCERPFCTNCVEDGDELARRKNKFGEEDFKGLVDPPMPELAKDNKNEIYGIVFDMYIDGYSDKEMGEILHLTRASISEYRLRMKLPAFSKLEREIRRVRSESC